LGREVISQQEQNEIDISSLPTGIYILYIRDQSDKLLKVERITKTSGE
jgi:hypothetical protein